MSTHFVALYLHVIGACVLLGTGAGIAFFMLISHRTRDPVLVAHVAGIVVLADTVFTATAAVLQPLTGWILAQNAGWPLTNGWVFWALLLYILIGACWLPVVWIQIKMKRLAEQARVAGTALPPEYDRLFRIWFALGIPAFGAVLAIVWLMLAKPV